MIPDDPVVIPDGPVARGTSQTPTRVSDYGDWLTKAEAATRIGVSTKAIERFAQARKLQQAFRPQAGSPDVRVYHPSDVDRLAQDRAPAPLPPFLVPGPTGQRLNGHGALAPVADPQQAVASAVGPGDDLLRVLVTAARKVLSETSQTPSLFLTIKEASLVTGLTMAYLRRQVDAGALKAVKDRGWRIRRKDLEQL
jgi:excisionase family DNA binding protein